nr:ATP synthase F0 subunit 8 [Haslea ostrearia]WAJ48221.1 hypothetical protein CCFAOBFC_00056 [Haslea ostrearia]
MAQFDVLILFTLTYNLLFILYAYYFFNITEYIPYYTETKKFRNKINVTLNTLKSISNANLYLQIVDFKYFKKFHA